MDNGKHLDYNSEPLMASDFLSNLIGMPLQYGLKSEDMCFYGFGFGNCISTIGWKGMLRKECTFVVHAQCEIQVIPQDKTQQIAVYSANTSCEKFHFDIERLVGKLVRRVALSKKNDLWLDLGEYWIVFVTYEDSEESWRLFATDKGNKNLIASSVCLNLLL